MTSTGSASASSSMEMDDWISLNNAIDDKINGNFFASELEEFPWFQLELPIAKNISGLTLVNREDCCGERLENIEVRAGFDAVTSENKGVPLPEMNKLCGVFDGPGETGGEYKILCANGSIEAKYITIQIMGKQYLQISEIELIGDRYRGTYSITCISSKLLIGFN